MVWMVGGKQGRRSGCGKQVAGDALGGKFCSIGEAAEGSKARGCSQAYEIEAGDGGLEVGVEDGGIFDCLHLCQQVIVEEVQAFQIHLVSGRGDDVVNVQFF